MLGGISRDQEAYERKIRNLKTDGLVKYVYNPKRGPPQGGTIPIRLPPILELPSFRHALNDDGGVGMGDDIDELTDMRKKGYRRVWGPMNQHTYEPGDHTYRLTRQEAAELMIEQLKLPNLRETRGIGTSDVPRKKYDSISPVGPRGLVCLRRTISRAIRRGMLLGEYDPSHCMIPAIIKDDLRFKSRSEKRSTEDAVIVFLLDVSGSTSRVLGYLQEVAWWADTLIRSFYKNVKNRYVHYDQFANETEAGLFYQIRSGRQNNLGLGLSMVYKILCEYPHSDRYLVHLTDGDYAGLEISEGNVKIYEDMQFAQGQPLWLQPGNPLTELLLPICNEIFVAEAGAYYNEGVHVKDWQSSPENYSKFLTHLVELDSKIRDRLRFVSHTDIQVQTKRAEILLETLKIWFDSNG